MPKTLTGMTLDEVTQKLTAVLDPKAYTAVGGRSYLTDINPAYLRETLTECFGMVGYGWFMMVIEKEIIDSEGDGKRYAGDMVVELRYIFLEENDEGKMERKTSFPIVGFGGHSSSHREDVMKGAVTNALGGAAKELLWQIGVYKGEVSHDNKPAAGAGGNGAKKTGTPDQPKAPRQAMDIEKLKSFMLKKVEQIGDYEASEKFRGFVRGSMNGLFPESQDRDREIHSVFNYFYGVNSSKDLNGAQIKALRDWLDVGDGMMPNAASAVEAKAIVQFEILAAGQKEMPV